MLVDQTLEAELATVQLGYFPRTPNYRHNPHHQHLL